MLEIHN